MRLERITSGTAVKLAYDGLDRIAEYDGSNALLRRYVHGPGVDEPIVWYEGTGTTDRRFLSSDERGSIISVTNSSGTVLGLNKYDEFGQPQSTNLGAFGYTGQAWLPTMSVWYYKARTYEPELGRFLQPDPIGYWDSPNLYAYVLNDPVNLVDPRGLESCAPDATVCAPRCPLGFSCALPGGAGGGAAPGTIVSPVQPRQPSDPEGGGSDQEESEEGESLAEEARDAFCRALSEGGLPIEIATSAAGGIAGWLGKKLVAKIAGKSAAGIMTLHSQGKKVIGSDLVEGGGNKIKALRHARAGWIGMGIGLGAGIYFKKDIDEFLKREIDACKKTLGD